MEENTCSEMKRFIFIISTIFGLSLCTTSCYQSDIDDLNDQIDALSSSEVADLASQLSSIRKSIASLSTTCDFIDSYITTLQSRHDAIEASIAAADEDIEALRDEIEPLQSSFEESLSEMSEELRSQIATEAASLLAQIEALKASLEAELEAVEASIDTLTAKDEELESSIEELEAYAEELETYISTSTDDLETWLSATYTTLEYYYSLCDDVAAVQATSEYITNSLDSLYEAITSDVRKEIISTADSLIAALVDSTLASKLSDLVDTVTSEYEKAIEDAATEISAAYATAIESAVDDLQTSLESWVSEQLALYYTAAQTDELISNFKTSMDGKLETQQAYLESMIAQLSDSLGTVYSSQDSLLAELCSQLEELDSLAAVSDNAISELKEKISSAKSELISGYTSAISTAINSCDGIIDDAISALNDAIDDKLDSLTTAASDLKSRVDAMNTDITTIKSDITDLLSDLSALSEKVDAILAMIQSVSLIPEYVDGSVLMEYRPNSDGEYVVDDLTLNYYINPTSAASTLASLGTDALSLISYYVSGGTRTSVSLNISSVTASDGVLSITIDGSEIDSDYIEDDYGLTVCLDISTGYNTLSSDFAKIVFSPTLYGYEWVDMGLSFLVAACNVGASDPEDYGDYFCWGMTSGGGTSASYYSGTKNICGNSSYDAATANWGSGWRLINASDEIVEIYGLTFEWTTQNGVSGALLTASDDETTVFIPAAGYYSSDLELTDAGSGGYYWTGGYSAASTAYGYNFSSTSFSLSSTASKNAARSVRAICDYAD